MGKSHYVVWYAVDTSGKFYKILFRFRGQYKYLKFINFGAFFICFYSTQNCEESELKKSYFKFEYINLPFKNSQFTNQFKRPQCQIFQLIEEFLALV